MKITIKNNWMTFQCILIIIIIIRYLNLEVRFDYTQFLPQKVFWCVFLRINLQNWSHRKLSIHSFFFRKYFFYAIRAVDIKYNQIIWTAGPYNVRAVTVKYFDEVFIFFYVLFKYFDYYIARVFSWKFQSRIVWKYYYYYFIRFDGFLSLDASFTRQYFSLVWMKREIVSLVLATQIATSIL